MSHRRGRIARGSLLSLVVACCVLWSEQSWAADPDPWLGPDKALHFAASASLSAGGYTLGAAAFDARYQALLLGGGLALGAGIGKETWDAMGHGDPSWRDFAWDLIGTAAGLGLAWGVDLAVRGTGPQHPVLAVGRNPLTVSATLLF